MHNANAPVVTSFSQDWWSMNGGGSLNVIGTGFTGATLVYFDQAKVNIIAGSDTLLNIPVPSCTAAFGGDASKCANQPVAVEVTVVTPNGTSKATCAARFYYTDTGANIPAKCTGQPGQGNGQGSGRGRGRSQHAW